MGEESGSSKGLHEWLQLAPKPPALRDGEKWHVFLSYRSVNRTWVLHLYDALKQAGFDVFLDQLEIAVGNSLVARLNQALATSASGVIVWSTEYSDSAWCMNEYETMQAIRASKPRFCFMVAKLAGVQLPPMVAKDVYVDFTDFPDGPQGGELLKLMYAVAGLPFPNHVLRAAQAIDDETRSMLTRIHGAKEVGNVEALRALVAGGGAAWQASPLLYSSAAEALISLKEYDLALEVLETASRQFRSAIRPIHLRALALARKAELARRRYRDASTEEERASAGAEADRLLLAAQQMLAELYNRHHRDPETLGIYARTWMDRFDVTKTRAFLERSRNLYAEAFRLNDTDYYTGVNAAAKSVFLGELDAAAEYATRVEALVGRETVPGDYWKSATVAEVQLIKRNFEAAANLYRAAVIDSPLATGNHDSTRQQAARLLPHLKAPGEVVGKVLQAFALD